MFVAHKILHGPEFVIYTDRSQGTVIFVSEGEQMPVSKKEVGECPVDAMMRVMDGRWKGTILWRLQEGAKRTSELKRSKNRYALELFVTPPPLPESYPPAQPSKVALR